MIEHVLEIYRITLLSNGLYKHRPCEIVLEIYRITLLSNQLPLLPRTIAVLEIYRITLLSNSEKIVEKFFLSFRDLQNYTTLKQSL